MKQFAMIFTAVVALAFIGPSDANSHSKKTQVGLASYYSMGTRTANGERYNPNGMTAAHRTLRFGTRVRVKNLRNGRSVVLRINDRGPFIRNRIIDVSAGAARKLGMRRSGIARVRVTVLR